METCRPQGGPVVGGHHGQAGDRPHLPLGGAGGVRDLPVSVAGPTGSEMVQFFANKNMTMTLFEKLHKTENSIKAVEVSKI